MCLFPQLIRYARACSSYECFILRAKRLSNKLCEQGIVMERLKSSFKKFLGRCGDLINQYVAFNHVTSIKSFDFSTLYTAIPHQKWKERLTSIIRNAFIFKNGNRIYKYLVLGHEKTYFVKEHSDSKKQVL